MSNQGRIRLRPEDAIDALVPAIDSCPDNVVFVTCLDAEGFVGMSECFRWPLNSAAPGIEQYFELARSEGAAAVMIATKPSGSITMLHECDIEFVHELWKQGRELGIILFDVILVESTMFRIMSQSLGHWPPIAPEVV